MEYGWFTLLLYLVKHIYEAELPPSLTVTRITRELAVFVFMI